jgi:hypothetical protein
VRRMLGWPGSKARAKNKAQQERVQAEAAAKNNNKGQPSGKVRDDAKCQDEYFVRGADILQHAKELDEELRISLAVLVGQNALNFPAQMETRVGSDLAWARDLIREMVHCFAIPDTLM